jgi:type I restriction enzyme, S subunit
LSAATPLPLKRFVDPKRPITYGIVQAGENDPDGVPYIRPVDMTDHGGVPDASQLLRTSPQIAQVYRRSEVLTGDIVISIGPSYGKTMLVTKELSGANLTQGTARVAVNRQNFAPYVRWALRSSLASAWWDAAVGGATFRALNLEPLSETPIPNWPLSRQRAIAEFLDGETARIDALIAAKLRLVQLLDDRLRLVAYELTASDGEVVSLRRIVRSVKTGTTPPAEELSRLDDGSVPWYSPGDVGNWLLLEEPARTLKEDAILGGWVPQFPSGSTLLVGIGATAGKIAFLDHPASGNQQITCLVPDPSVLPRFLSWQLLARRDEIRATAPFTTLPIINNEFIRSLAMVVPPVADQVERVGRLDQEASRVQRLVAQMKRQVALLHERRLALITAAVTGNLDIPATA